MFIFGILVLHIAVIGGVDSGKQPINEAEVVRIQSNGFVSTSSCHFPSLQTYGAAGAELICGGYPATNECHRFNQNAWSWEIAQKLNIRRYGHSMTSVNNQFFVCGGRDDSGEESASCEKYNGKWEVIKPHPTPLAANCLVPINNSSILSIGGWDGSAVRE